MKETIAVIFGGRSVEHDISIITGLQVLKNISNKYNALPIYIEPNGCACLADNLDEVQTYLNFDRRVKRKKRVSFSIGEPYILTEGLKRKMKIDCAILCTHGKNGEDGSLQGLLQLCKIPYTSPKVMSSAICMDKAATKRVLKNAKIATPKFVDFYAAEFVDNREGVVEKIKGALKEFPLIIKPARLGSSVGISICKNEKELVPLINEALLFDDKVIVEEFIGSAREFCCAALKVGSKILTSDVKEVAKNEIFTFEDKYLKEKDEKIMQIPAKLQNKIKDLTALAYRSLECDGVVRVDFLLGKELEINEVNTIPGSLAFNLFNLPFRDLIDTLITEAKLNQQQSDRHLYEFSSEALAAYAELTSKNKYSK